MTRQNVRMSPTSPATPSEPRTAAIYCRISLDKTGESLGVARQEQECRAFCERMGLEVIAVHIDNDMSATKGLTRPGFEAMFNSSADAWVTWATDRLVRKTGELLRIIEAGPIVYTVQAGPIDLATPAGRMVAKMLTAVAELEGEQRSARQRLAYRQRAQDGKPQWSVRPFGFNRNGSPLEEEAAHLRQAYADLLEGESCSGIAAKLNRQGVTTASGKTWCGRDVSDLLKAARNAGLRTYHGEVVAKGTWTPLVDETLYRAALAILTDPTRTTNPHGGNTPRGFLSGLAVCGKCGAPLWIGSRFRGGPNDGEKAYWCSSTSHCLKVPMAWADAMVTSALLTELANRPAVDGEGDNREEALKLKADREVEQAKVRELAEAWSRDEIDFEVLRIASARLKERVAEIDAELASLQERVPITGMGRDLKGELFYTTKDGKRELTVSTMHSLLRENFSQITMHPRGRGNSELRPELLECTSRATGETVYGGQAREGANQVMITPEGVAINGVLITPEA